MLNKKKSSAILIVALTATIVFLFLFNSYEDKKSSINFNKERVFSKDISFIKSFPVDKRYSVMTNSGNSLFFVNWKESKIYKFSKDNFELENTYGTKGEGPKENLLISRFDIGSNSYTTIDTKKYTIQEVSFNDSLIYYYKFPKPLMRSSKVGDNYMFANMDADFNLSFEKFDLKTKKSSPIIVADKRFENKKNTGLIYDGFFTKNNSYEAFVSYSNDVIFCFDSNMNYMYSIDMIYDIPDPRYEKLSDGNSYPSKDNYNCTEHAYLDNNNILYILTVDTDKANKDFRIIDAYDIISKQYLYSIKTQNINGNQPEEIIIENGVMYAIYDNVFAKFQLKNN